MTDLIPTPISAVQSKRQRKSIKAAEFTAPVAAKTPQAALDTQIAEVRASNQNLGYNTGNLLVQAQQTGFAEGLKQALDDGAASAFFQSAIELSGASLL